MCTRSHFSELNSLDTGLLLEVWDKGMLWDKAIGYFWAPLQNLQGSKVVSPTAELLSHVIFKFKWEINPT